MTTKQAKTDAADAEKQATDLLRDVSQDLADLYRKDSQFGIRVIFLPDIDAPEGAHITLFDRDDKIIDVIELKVDPDANDPMGDFIASVMEIYHHPLALIRYPASQKAADKVTGRETAEDKKEEKKDA